MKTKIFALFAAMMLLVGTTAMAQSDNTKTTETELKGDVNNDGVVDVADIAAVIAVMHEQSADGTKYYWYVGTTNPAEMTSIEPIVTDNSSTGWREIGTVLPTYNAISPLFNADSNNILFAARNYYYIAVPSSAIKIYNVANGSVMDGYNDGGTVTISGVVYTIYASKNKASGFVYKLF